MPKQFVRLLFGYSLAALVLASSVSAQAQSPITGKVTLPDGMTAIPGVNITLVGPFEGTGLNAVRSNPLMASEIADATSTPQAKSTTGGDGRFRFDRLAPGQYAILAKLDGYFGSPVPGKPPNSVLVTALTIVVTGEPTPDVSMVMVRGATIRGRIRDSTGNPVVGATVRAYTIEIVKGPLELFPISPKKTDAQGGLRPLSARSWRVLCRGKPAGCSSKCLDLLSWRYRPANRVPNDCRRRRGPDRNRHHSSIRALTGEAC